MDGARQAAWLWPAHETALWVPILGVFRGCLTPNPKVEKAAVESSFATSAVLQCQCSSKRGLEEVQARRALGVQACRGDAQEDST